MGEKSIRGAHDAVALPHDAAVRVVTFPVI